MKVHFSVSGDFITEHARDLWLEYKFSQALDLLKCVIGISQEQIEGVLFGTLKLTGTNTVCFRKDSWTPPEGYCPSMMEALKRGENYLRLQELEKEEIEDMIRACAKLAKWGLRSNKDREEEDLLMKRLTKTLGREEAIKRVNAVVAELEEESELLEKNPVEPHISKEFMYAHHMRVRMELAGLDTSVLPPLVIGQEPPTLPMFDEPAVPVRCKDMSSPSGWILPTGEYYQCNFTGHILLATQLLEKRYPKGDGVKGGYEGIAENLGWVKVCKHMSGLSIFCKKTLTKKQVEALKRYAAYHKKDFDTITDLLDLPD